MRISRCSLVFCIARGSVLFPASTLRTALVSLPYNAQAFEREMLVDFLNMPRGPSNHRSLPASSYDARFFADGFLNPVENAVYHVGVAIENASLHLRSGVCSNHG